MKKTSALCLATALVLGSTGTAHAEHYRDYRPAHHHHHHHRHHGHRADWLGPTALLAITGLAIGAVAYGQSPPQVYTVPPRPMPPPPRGNWYYCYSSGQYYPYTRYCPEGWQAVPAR